VGGSGWPGHRWSRGNWRRRGFHGTAFPCCLCLLGQSFAFRLVCLDSSLDTSLGLQVVGLFLSLLGSLLDLFLPCKLLLEVLDLLGGLLSNFLGYGLVTNHSSRHTRIRGTYLVTLSFLLFLDCLSGLLLQHLLTKLFQPSLLLLLR